MRHNVIPIGKLNEIVDNSTLKHRYGTYIKIDKLIEELQSIESETIVDVSPNCLEAAINDISNYLSKGGCSFVATLADAAEAIHISRPTLNEWHYAGVVNLKKRKAATKKEKSMLKQRSSGYDITDLLYQLKTYANNLDV